MVHEQHKEPYAVPQWAVSTSLHILCPFVKVQSKECISHEEREDKSKPHSHHVRSSFVAHLAIELAVWIVKRA